MRATVGPAAEIWQLYSIIRHYTSLDCGLPLPSLLAGTVAGSIRNEEGKDVRRCMAQQYNQTTIPLTVNCW